MLPSPVAARQNNGRRVGAFRQLPHRRCARRLIQWGTRGRASMARLTLRVLGPPRLEQDGHPVALNLRRAVALLVYLAATGHPQSRESLAALLWPDGDDREARARLRRTRHRLSEALGK